MSKEETKMTLTGTLEKVAVGAIEAFAKAEKAAVKGYDSMSMHLLTIAKAAIKAGGKDKAGEVFTLMCRHAETVYKQGHMKAGKEQPIKTLLPFWPVAKSQVFAAMKANVITDKTESVYEAVKATPKKDRAPKTPTDKTGESKDKAITLPNTAEGKAFGEAYERLKRTLVTLVVQRVELLGDVSKRLNTLCDSIEEDAHLATTAPTDETRDTGDGPPEEKVA